MADDPKGLEWGPSCPIPISQYPQVMLAHGGGGQLTHQLIERMFVPAFAQSRARRTTRRRAASRSAAAGSPSRPIRTSCARCSFPGGDIGTLAVNGTVNDLAMCGARPLYLSAGFILEEGLPMETLWRVVSSMKAAADAAGVALVTGDTKVVDRGKGDGLYINTAGIGVIEHDRVIAPASVRAGDAVLISGDIGRHGMAIMAVREGLQFESSIESDCAPLAAPVLALLGGGIDVHCLRDLTRGGLASALVEIAEASGLHVHVREAEIPVREDVRGACEILGFDPALRRQRGTIRRVRRRQRRRTRARGPAAHDVSGGARAIGTVDAAPAGLVTLRSRIGATRIVDMLSGEQLPRIC